MELPVSIPLWTKIPPENFGHSRCLVITVFRKSGFKENYYRQILIWVKICFYPDIRD